MYTVYVLKSIKNGQRYVGYTSDLQRRLKEHNSGQNISTKGHIPYKLMYTEEYKTLAEALKREHFLKSGSGRELVDEIIK